MATVNAGDQKQTNLIDKVGLEERPINMAPAFEQQRFDSEMLAQQAQQSGSRDCARKCHFVHAS
jgi:hypothetical protein